ncbi:ATP-binding protein [Patescibacteria group bacterium]|nr:ATP-binding protein [Patescibacteria group bacterium]
MDNIIKTILYEWREHKLPKIIRRETDLTKYLNLKTPKIITITGFRRVGKTYLIFDLIEELLKTHHKEEVVYINFEDERIPSDIKVLTQLIPTINETYNHTTKYLFLDEIQNIPNWSQWVRRIYDQENIKIFITGSSSKLSSKEIPTELRGRCIEKTIMPLSFREFLLFKNIKIDLASLPYLDKEKSKTNKALEEYLYYGGLPEIVLTSKEHKFEILQQYYKTVISQDIMDRFKIKNETMLKALLMLLLNSTIYSISKIYKTLRSAGHKIGPTTVMKYISYIENSYFLNNLFIFSYTVKDRLQYPKKIYFIDNGFINALSSTFSKNTGRLFENIVFNKIKSELKINEELFYWQDKRQKEVDFVVKKGNKIINLIQVSSNLDNIGTKEREINNLLKANKELNCNNLTIINKDIDSKEKIGGQTIKFTPLYKFLLE